MPEQTEQLEAYPAEVTRARVYELVNRERDRQHAKWGGTHPWGSGDCSSRDVHFLVKYAVLAEEVGEVSRAVLESDFVSLKAELVQVAAVAVAWLESLT